MGQLEDMAAFVRIVETGSLSRAAEQMGIAKSAVSRRLVELEDRVGVQLLQRTTRASQLTEAGRSYYERALQILADVTELNTSVSDTQTKLQGELKVALPLTFGLQHLAPIINAFADEHPDLSIHLDFSDRQVDLVEEGFDLAVRIADLEDSTHIARRLAPIRMILCAAPSYLAKHGKPKTLDDLRTHQTLQYTLNSGTGWRFEAANGKAKNVRIRPKIVANNGEYLREAAIAGHGIARLPTFIVWEALAAGTLKRVLPRQAISPLNAFAIYPQTRHLSHRVRALIDRLVESCAGKPYWDQGI